MSDFHTEEEQLADLRRMWNQYGKQTLGIFIIVAILTGAWFFYQARQTAYYENGAVEYHKLLEMMEASNGEKQDMGKLEDQAELLKKDYSKSPYAAAGAMLIAKQSVDQGNITEAKAQLEWVSLNSKNSDFAQLAHARLARILLSEKNYDAALKELDNQTNKRYDPEFQEIRGDILNSMQKPEEARAAYQAALDTMPNTPEKILVQMKYDDLASPKDNLWKPETDQSNAGEKP